MTSPLTAAEFKTIEPQAQRLRKSDFDFGVSTRRDYRTPSHALDIAVKHYVSRNFDTTDIATMATLWGNMSSEPFSFRARANTFGDDGLVTVDAAIIEERGDESIESRLEMFLTREQARELRDRLNDLDLDD